MPNTEATAEVKAIFSMVDQSAGVAKQITDNLKGMADAAKSVSTEVPRSLAEVATRAGVAWRPTDIVQPVVPEVAPIAPAVGDQMAQATAAIDKVSGHWGKLRESIDSVSDRIGTKLRGMFESVEGVAGRVAGRIGKAWQGLGGTLALFGAGGVVEAGIEYAFHGAEKLVAEVEKLKPRASAIGITIQQLQDYDRYAKDAGVSSDKLDKALTRLTQTLGEVQEGGNKKATEALADLQVNTKGAHGELRTTADVFPDIIDALNKITDPTKRAAEAAAIFKLNWKDIAPIMDANSAALNKARTEQEKIGHLSDEEVKRAEDYAAAHKRMSDALTGLQETVGATLLPAVTPLMDEITNVTAAFNHWAQSVEGQHEVAKTFEYIAEIIHSTRTDLEAIANTVERFAKFPEGAKPIPPEGAPAGMSTWTPGGILAPSEPSQGGGTLPLESITGQPPPIAPNGTVNVNITHDNAPPGTRMNVSTQGNGIKTTANTGWSMPGIQNPWEQPKQPQGPWAPQ